MKYAPRSRVRVKAGVLDPDFPDIPLGGWRGRVVEANGGEKPPVYLIEWDRQTVESAHPIYVKRCERDGLDGDKMWLGESDIEQDSGDPVPMEQPVDIRTRPLSPDDQDDRIRAILGLTGDDPLPDVTKETLSRYQEHLSRHLKPPFEVGFSEGGGARYTLIDLVDPGEYDEELGPLALLRRRSEVAQVRLAELSARPGDPRARLLDDYGYWFNNWR